MAKKKFIGQLISIKYTDRPTPIMGFVIDYNDDWTLMKYNFGDYVIDGYIILRHKNIKGFERGEKEKFHEKIIKLKKQNLPEIKDFQLVDLETILISVTERYGIFELKLKSEIACYLGKFIAMDKGKLVIKFLTPEGKWSKRKMEFRQNDIRTIAFDNDYINSLKLLL